MRRYNPIITLSGCDQGGGVGSARFGVVHGRITEQIFEHFLAFICRAVVIGPARACGEGVIAQHVEHAHTRQRHLEEIWALCRHRPDQETTVGSAAHRKSLFTRVALVDEKFGCGDKVVEDVLLLQFGADNVPCFAVLCFLSYAYLGCALLCFAVLCFALLRCLLLFLALLCLTLLCLTMLCYATLCFAVLRACLSKAKKY